MNPLRETVSKMLFRITGKEQVPEFTRSGGGDLSFVLRDGSDPGETAAEWNSMYPGTARAEARGNYLNLYLTEEALLEDMKRLSGELHSEDPVWSGPHAAEIYRLRADRAFGLAGAFSHESAMAVLKLEHGLYTEIPEGPLHPEVSLALEAVLQRKNRE